MKYLLDTDICSYIIQGRSSALASLKLLDVEDWGISSLSYFEIERGIALKANSKWAARAKLFLENCETLSFGPQEAHYAAKVSAQLQLLGKPSGRLDELIGGHALFLGRTLVTNNVRHFEHVTELKLTSWV